MHKQYLSSFKKVPILLAALLLSFSLPFISLPEIIHATCNLGTRCDAWGALEEARNTWTNGVNVYSNGATATGPSPDTYNCFTIAGGAGNLGCAPGQVATGVKWQCVELVNRFYLTNGWTTGTWTGNGNTIKDSLPSGFTYQAASTVTYVNAGDTVTFTGQVTGHAAVVDTVSNGNIQLASQNTQSTTLAASWNSSTQTLTSSALGSLYTVQGIIHHPGGTPPPNNTVTAVKKLTQSDGTNEVIWSKNTDVNDSYWKSPNAPVVTNRDTVKFYV